MASAPAAVSYETLAKAPDTYFKAVDAMDIEGVLTASPTTRPSPSRPIT